jgi:hypothetical protein
MPRSSESVAALAAALAKAQAELVNPEKSLTAIMRTGGPGEGQRSFRYAPLSSGLDIVRKTLGRHEIATVQTTAIDQTAGMVNLTTTLAHASGEWIASDWPVCPIAETANPQRMGAALTYARRYALFTLVGIAGEDDLDAPDLCVEPPSLPSVVHRSLKPTDGQSWMPPRKPGNGHARNGLRREVPRTLDPDQSTAVREKLLTEIENIKSGDLAAGWARRALSAKNALIEADAKLVEDVFERRLSEIASSDPAASLHDGTFGTQVAEPQKTVPAEAPSQVKRRASTRASSRWLRHVATATRSIFGMSPNSRVSCAPASPQTHIIFGSCSPARSAARPAMNSWFRSAAYTTVRCIALVTSAHGGIRPASSR